eukprot:6837041-Alexandrium_andersonii.AAC.1
MCIRDRPKGKGPACPVRGRGVAGGWKVAQGKRTVRQTQQPPKSASAGVSAALASRLQQSVSTDGAAASGFTRPGA